MRTHPFSFSLVHWFFTYIFFFISPLVRLKYKLFPLLSVTGDYQALLYKTNNLILLWCLFYIFTYKIIKIKKYIFSFKFFPKRRKRNRLLYWVIISVVFFFSVFILFTDPMAAISRGGGMSRYIGGKSLNLVFNLFIRPFCFFLFLIFLFKNFLNKKFFFPIRIQWLFIFISFITLNFPTGTTRYYIFAIWVTLLFYFIFDKIKTGFIGLGILCFGLLGAEFFSQFRKINVSEQISLNSNIDLKYFGTMHFDGYEMLASAILYVEKFDILYGENLLGAILFFVPRTFWATKPISSGSLIMRECYASNSPYGNFENVSSPLVAEFFIGFGLFGVIFGAILTALICALLDANYFYLNKNKNKNLNAYKMIYLTLVGLFLITLRGSILVAFSSIIGICTAFYTATLLNDFGVKFGLAKVKLVNAFFRK